MINVYDIILNLLDSNRLYESFEWNKKDNIEHIKKIPMVRVSTSSLDDIIHSVIVIDSDFLTEIYKKTEIYNDDGLSVIDYGVLFTDNFKIVAVEFNKEGKSLFKSNLLLDEEEEILELSNEVKLRKIDYKVVKKNKCNDYLTREEEFRRNYLLKELKNSYKKKLYEKINYLYEEIYPRDHKSIDERYKILIHDITNNYDAHHNKIFQVLKLINKKKKTTN